MEKLLHLFKYVDGVNDTPFPSKKQQGILYDFKYDAERMGNVPTITGTLMHPLCLDEEWGNGRVYVLFNNEKYFLKQTPTSSYSNEDTRYKHELDLVSERTILNDVYFYDVVASDVSNDKPVSNSSNFSFYGDIHEFAQRLNYSLQYANVGYSVVVDKGITSDAKGIAFQDQYIMDVLQEIYKTYEIPFYFVGKVIHIGYTNSSIETPFKYGVRDALLSISKNNITQKIVNRITGIGSSDNIPYYYPNFDPKGETEILLRGEPTNVVTIENLNAYKKVKLSDKFIYSSESSYRLDYIDKSKYSVTKEPYLVSEPNASTRIWEVILDFPFSVDIYQDSYIEIGYSKGDDGFTNYQARLYRNSELRDRFDAFGTIPYYRLIEGNYNFSFTLRYEFKEGSEKQDLTMEDIPNIVNNALELSIYANVEGYKQWTLNKASNVVELSKFGLKYDGTPKNGDIITFKQLSYITPQPNLMPPIYRETKANERFYNALNNTYLNPSTNNYYHFESPFVVGKPKEQIVSFEDIKPSIVGITNASGLRIDMFSEFAYDTNDNDEFDEEGNYLHPYFFAKLRKFDGDFGFNLFEHSIEEDEMVISMTSGSCGSCNFVIGVDKETQKNIVQVDENGDLLRDSNGNVLYGSPQEKQNDTINNEVWIALKKDIETFGVIMPNANNNYRPNVSDTFVILHIDLPKAYIFAAENQLKEALIEYMFENNSEKFNFSINFSRIYFAENPNILAQLNENSHIRLEYNNIVYSLYVSSFAYSMSNDNPLPEIKIELSKDLTIKKESILTQLSNASKQLVVTIKRVDSSINATNKDVAKTTSTTMTSISETNARVDNVEKVLRDIQDGSGTSSGGGSGSINYDDLEDYLTQEEYAKKEDIPSLDGYVTNDDLNNKGFATENWVRNQGYLTQHQDLSAYAKSEEIAKTYATKVELSITNTNLSNLLASHNTLRSDFDSLNNLLNSDVNSTIDTWNEVVAFLDGYSDSDDLATILSQMNTDITNKVGYDEFEKVSDATKDLLSYFDVNGYALNAINALKLGGIDAGNYWHKGNSGTLDYNWKAKKLNVRTLVIPTSEPTDLSQGEVGFYLGTAGQGAEEPNGSGGLDLTELWAELGSEDYAKKIHISHIPTIQYSSIAGRPSALANPYALTINGVVYDGSEAISLDISAGGGVADAVAWGNVFNKPTTISGYGITDAYTKDSVDLKLSNYLPKSGGTINSSEFTPLTIKRATNGGVTLGFENINGYLGSFGVYPDSSGVGYPVFVDLNDTSNTLIHTGNYAGTTDTRYLQLSGGKISGSITFTRDGVDKAFFSYGDSNGGYISVGGAFLGVLSDGTPHYNRNILIHSGNYSSYALSLSGGIVNGNLKINYNDTYPLYINGAEKYSVIQLQGRGKRAAEVGWLNDDRGNFAFILNVDSPGLLSVNKSGAYFSTTTSNFTQYALIHTGNYADTTDKRYLQLSGGTIEGTYGALNIYRNTGNHPSLVKFSNTNGVLGYLGFNADKEPVYFAENLSNYLLIHSGNIGSQRVANADTLDDLHAADFAKAKRYVVSGTDVNSIGYGHTNEGNMFVGPMATFGTTTYFIEIQSPYNKPELYYRQHNANGYSDIKQIAFTDSNITGNAATATKLQTARTIWGQSFDGTQNVGGNLSIEWSKIYWNNDIGNYYIGWNTSEYAFDFANYYGHRFYSGGSERMRITKDGNILIGTTKDNGYKLQVNGTFKANGLIIPTSAPTDLKSGDHALYLGSVGEGAELPSGVGGLDVAELWAELAKADESKQINVSHIPTIEIARVSGLQTALNNKADASALSSYLLKSGGTLTGDLTINKSGQSILYLGNVGSVYYDATDDTTVLFNGNTGYPALKVKGGTDAPIYRYNYTDYTIIHSGNIGSQSVNYATTAGSAKASDVYAWAKKSSLAASDVPNLDWSKITSGKPTTLAGYGITDAISTNGGTISGRFKVGDYIQFTRLADSKTYLLGQPYTDDATKLSFYDGSAWRVILHSGNYSSYALPLSGGTMSGVLVISSPSWGEQLIINRTTANAAPSIKFQNNGTTLGYLGMRTDEKLYYVPSTGGNGYDIIHSGNIGSYNAGSATKLADNTAFTAWGQTFFENGKPKNVDGNITLYKNSSNNIEGWTRGIVVRNSSNTILCRLGFVGGGETLNYAFIGNTYSSPYISFLSNGNVLIGSTVDYGYKLDVNGSARIGTNLNVTSNITLGGNLEVGTTDSCYIALKRNSLNYFHATGANGYIGFVTNAKGTSRANCDLLIQDKLVCAGITEYTDLGSTTYRWKGINAKTLNLSSDAKISGEMDANALVIPTAPPTNPQPGKHYLYLA